MESRTYVRVIPREDPIPTQYSIPQDLDCPLLGPCFRINLYLTHVEEHDTNSEILSTTTIFNDTFFIPSYVLCDCDQFDVFNPDSFTMTYLHETFSSIPFIPFESWNSIIFLMGERAKQMVEENYEELDILEMAAMVRINTRPIVVQDQEDDEDVDEHHYASVATILNSLEKVDYNDASSSCWGDECVICLEELCNNGSESKLGRTKCKHVFHEECIVKWLQQCSYSCPLCRSQIPLDEYDQENSEN